MIRVVPQSTFLSATVFPFGGFSKILVGIIQNQFGYELRVRGVRAAPQGVSGSAEVVFGFAATAVSTTLWVLCCWAYMASWHRTFVFSSSLPSSYCCSRVYWAKRRRRWTSRPPASVLEYTGFWFQWLQHATSACSCRRPLGDALRTERKPLLRHAGDGESNDLAAPGSQFQPMGEKVMLDALSLHTLLRTSAATVMPFAMVRWLVSTGRFLLKCFLVPTRPFPLCSFKRCH